MFSRISSTPGAAACRNTASTPASLTRTEKSASQLGVAGRQKCWNLFAGQPGHRLRRHGTVEYHSPTAKNVALEDSTEGKESSQGLPLDLFVNHGGVVIWGEGAYQERASVGRIYVEQGSGPPAVDASVPDQHSHPSPGSSASKEHVVD